jgi:hypothetical protein
MPGSVTIFITTPRSGTQWVADTVGKAYGELAVVQHEPIKYAYRPREFMRAYDRVEEEQRLPAVAAHLEEIAAIDDSLAYVEVGFPAVASVPLYQSCTATVCASCS